MAPPTPSSVFRASNTALITGGASGVGLAVAALCRRAGMNLALVDNNAELLARAKRELPSGSGSGSGSSSGGADGGAGGKIETYEMDVSKAEQWAELRTKVKASFERVDFLMLNAGVGAKGGWENLDYFHKVRVPLFFQHARSTTPHLTAPHLTVAPLHRPSCPGLESSTLTSDSHRSWTPTCSA